MEKPICIKCESDKLEEMNVELLNQENEEWTAWYKCEECGEEFGVHYEGDVGLSWWN